MTASVNVESLRKCVIVGGAGAVGSMFAALFSQAGAEVCIIDAALPPSLTPAERTRVRGGDITAPAQWLTEELGGADMVMLALPGPVALAAAARVASSMKHGALLVETLSVKSGIAGVIRAEASPTEAVGLNPMFAPSLGMAGRPVATVVMREGPRVAELLGLISAWGGRVVRLDAERHDQLAAASQTLTHAAILAFGLALADLDANIEELSAVAPPPHTMLLSLLARIVSGTPEVYWDVQSANPYAPQAREALVQGIRRLARLVDGGDEAAFAGALQQVQGLLGQKRELYRELCARVFSNIHLAPVALSEETETVRHGS